MKALANRVARLERPYHQPETAAEIERQRRLEAALRRIGKQPGDPAKLRGLTVVQILNRGRDELAREERICHASDATVP